MISRRHTSWLLASEKASVFGWFGLFFVASECQGILLNMLHAEDSVNIIDNETLPDCEEDQRVRPEEKPEKSQYVVGVSLALLSSLLFTVCGLLLKQITVNVSDILGTVRTHQHHVFLVAKAALEIAGHGVRD